MGALRVEPSRYFPRFGTELASQALAFVAEGTRVETGFCIASGSERLVYDLAAGATLGERSYGW